MSIEQAIFEHVNDLLDEVLDDKLNEHVDPADIEDRLTDLETSREDVEDLKSEIESLSEEVSNSDARITNLEERLDATPQEDKGLEALVADIIYSLASFFDMKSHEIQLLRERNL